MAICRSNSNAINFYQAKFVTNIPKSILSNNNERRRLLSRIIRLGKGQCVETQMVFGP